MCEPERTGSSIRGEEIPLDIESNRTNEDAEQRILSEVLWSEFLSNLIKTFFTVF